LSSKSGTASFTEKINSILYKDASSQDPKTKDTDQDGLTDWQEEIYKTDPNNPDTDKDGYLDGEEVMSGYDPLKPAPDDKLSDKSLNPRPAAGSLGTNLTDEFAKALSEAIKQSSASDFQSDSSGNVSLINNNLVDNALAAALVKSPQLYFVPTLQDSDIKISNETTISAGQNFVSQVANILAAKIPQEKSAIEVAQISVQQKDYSELDKYIKGYAESFSVLKEIPVPANWKEIHKKNLALILVSANIFQSIKSIDQDPLKALLSLQQYQQEIIPGFKTMADEMIKLISEQKSAAQP